MAQSYSFLDVAVLDAVRDRFAAGEALAILPVELDQLIWANGPGARAFGYDDVEAAVGAPSGLGATARRQIAATRGFPEIGRDRPIQLRAASGLSSRIETVLASAVTLPDGEAAILIARPAGAPSDADAVAARAIGGFPEGGHFLAMARPGGVIRAATPGFEALELDPGALSAMADRLERQENRIVKALIPGAGGQRPAGLARLTDTDLLLVVIDQPVDAPQHVADHAQAEEEPQEDEGPEQEEQPAAEAADEAPTALDMIAESTAAAQALATASEVIVPDAAPETTQAVPYDDQPELTDETPPELLATDYPEPPSPDEASGWAPPADEQPEEILPEAVVGWTEPSPSQAVEEAPGSSTDGLEEAAELTPETTVAEETGDSAPQAAAIAPPADRASGPVRFVWRTDAEGRFSQLSPEFATAVGEPAAAIVGRSFDEVAEQFGLDPDGEIAGLLARRDTWSGRSVLWPVAGTDLRIPVDLAALPVYGRARDFQGFRGFGVARAGDALVDPAETGLKIAEAEGPGEPAQSEPPALDPFRGEKPAIAVTPAPDRRASDKIIRLAEHRPLEPGLSTGERIAFREIGERLKRETENGTPAEPPHNAADEAEAEAQLPAPVEETAAEAPTGTDAGEASSVVSEDIAVEGVVAEDEVPPAEAAAEDQVKPETEAEAPTGIDAGEASSVVSEDIAVEGIVAEDEVLPVEAAAEDQVKPETEAEAPVPPEPEDAPTEAEAREAEAPAAPRRRGLSLLSLAQWEGQTEPVEAPDPAIDPSDEPAVDDGPQADAVPAAEDAQPKPAAEQEQPDTAAEVGEVEPAATPEEPAADAHADDGESQPSSPLPSEDAEASVQETDAEMDVPAAGAPGGIERRRSDTSLLERLPVPVLVHAGDVLHYANDEFFKLTGYGSVEELAEAGGIGALFADSYGEEHGGREDRQMRLVRRDGEAVPVDAFLQSVPWNGGKALLLVLARAREGAFAGQSPLIAELEARVAEMRTIIDTATDGVVLIAPDGAIRSISRPAEALFGFDSDEVKGKPFVSLFAIESQRAARDYLNGLSDNGVASVLNDGREVIGREAEGRFIPLFMTIGRLPNDSGYCAVLRDITQWKRAEEELTQARAVAERASSMKTEFLARVSHEIRTPLNAIIGFSELILDEKFGPVANDRYRDYLRDINKSGNHVLDLVNDLLDISKIEAGQQDMVYEAVSLNDTLAETVAMMQPQANRERVIIRSSFASRLPDVVADRRSVRQIALNILSNAIRYTQAGGQVIVSTAYETSGDVIMRVRDTGIGMTQSEIEQSLKPFKQINALNRQRGDGTGLGLPLTKAMVEANRARFSITSTPGDGTLVEINFPSTRVLAE